MSLALAASLMTITGMSASAGVARIALHTSWPLVPPRSMSSRTRSGRGASSARRRAVRASDAALTTWNLPSAAWTAVRTSSASSTARIVDLGALTPRTVAEAPEARPEPLHGEPLPQLASDDQRKDQQSADAGDQQCPVGGAAPSECVAAGGAEPDLDDKVGQHAEHGGEQVVPQPHACQAKEITLQAARHGRRHAKEQHNLFRLLRHGVIDRFEGLAAPCRALDPAAQHVARERPADERRERYGKLRRQQAAGEAEERAGGERKDPCRQQQEQRGCVGGAENEQRLDRMHLLDRVLEARPPFLGYQHCG